MSCRALGPRRQSRAQRVLAFTGLLVVLPSCCHQSVDQVTSKDPSCTRRLESPRPPLATYAGHADRRIRDSRRGIHDLQFRTMRVDAEAKSGAVWAKENDPV